MIDRILLLFSALLSADDMRKVSRAKKDHLLNTDLVRYSMWEIKSLTSTRTLVVNSHASS